jgi:hypothetical protein
MVVFRHVGELPVLRDLEDPERDRKHREYGRDDVLHRRKPQRHAAPIVVLHSSHGRS